MNLELKKKEIRFKIVYYGPAVGGKTTNISLIYSKYPGQKGKLVTIDTKGERTLFFDFLPIELELVKNFKTRFYIYTVPGQVHYKIARKLVLKGADGIIYVADSQKNRREDNIEILHEMENYMETHGMKKNSTPMVFQYNKRDLPDLLRVNELNTDLNPNGSPYFEAVAIKGIGVFKSLEKIIKEILSSFLSEAKRKEG